MKIFLTYSGFEQVIISLFFFWSAFKSHSFSIWANTERFSYKKKNVHFKNTARPPFFLIKNIDQNQARLRKYLSEISCCVARLISYGCPVVHNTTGFQQAFLKYQGHRRSHRWTLTINNTAVKQAQTWSADVTHSPTSCFYSYVFYKTANHFLFYYLTLN